MYAASQRTPNGVNRSNISSTSTTATPAKVAPLSASAYREQLINNRYHLTHPNGVFPLDPSLPPSNQPQQLQHKYPDFQPWKPSARDEALAITHLQQGYSEAPFVTNEFVSARNIMHNLLQSRNALPDLSSNFLKVINVRSSNNLIPSSTFKIPSRVTLTDQKREAWLKDLANESIPLRKLSRTIPHGIRNKNLIEHCIMKNVPINRAIWLVRCVSGNELKTLRRKNSTNSISGNLNGSVEANWFSEWTNQVVEYLERLSFDYLKFESFIKAKESWRFKIRYFLRFLSNLYMEKLIEQDIFKNWLLKFFKNCQNFEIPLSLSIIKIFWCEILKTDYLIKEFTEALLLKHHKIANLKNLLDLKDSNLVINDLKLNGQIKQRLLANFKQLLIQSFDQSVDNFIIPSNWNLLENTLKNSILNLQDPSVLKRFELISYRNESLMINYSISNDDLFTSNDLVNKLDSFEKYVKFHEMEYVEVLSLIFPAEQQVSTQQQQQQPQKQDQWKKNLFNLIKWAITKYRTENHRVQLTVEILRRFKPTTTTETTVQLRDIEAEILNILFMLSLKTKTKELEDIDFQQFYHLLNELATIKLFRIITYMRKIISSGLVYLTDNAKEKYYHLSVLSNLKFEERTNSNGNSTNNSSVNNTQLIMILKKLSSDAEALFADLEQKFWKIWDSLDRYPLERITVAEDWCDNVGLKLRLSSRYLFKLKTNCNLTGMTYDQFENIIVNFLALNDHKNLCDFVQYFFNSVEQQNQSEDLLLTHNGFITIPLNQMCLISQLMMVYDKMWLLNVADFEKFVIQFINFFRVSMVSTVDFTFTLIGCDKEFWGSLKNYQNYQDAGVLEELEALIKTDWKKMSVNIEMIKHDLQESQIGLSYEQFVSDDHNRFHNHFQTLIRNVFNLNSSGEGSQSQIKSSLNLLKFLQRSNNSEFHKILFIFIKKKFSISNSPLTIEINSNWKQPLFDLIRLRLISLKMVLDFFINTITNATSLSFTFPHQQFLLDLLCKTHYNDLKLDLVRDSYKQEHQEQVLFLIMNMYFIIKKSQKNQQQIQQQHEQHHNHHHIGHMSMVVDNNSASSPDDMLMELMRPVVDKQDNEMSQYKMECQRVFLHALVHDREIILKFVSGIDKKGLSAKEVKLIIVEFLNKDFLSVHDHQQQQQKIEENDSITNRIELASETANSNLKHVDRFNLPLFQVLFRLILDLKGNIQDNHSPINCEQMITSFMQNNSDFSILGSLFELVEDDIKVQFIHFLECLFLNNKSNFSADVLLHQQHSKISLSSLSEILGKLSNGLPPSIPLSEELIFSLDNSLDSLLKLVNQQPISEGSTNQLESAIRLFLKIVIIHKNFLIGLIIERNSIKQSFLNNLVSLLSSQLFRSNLALKNLLYDLIRSINSALLNQAAITGNTNLKLPFSLTNLSSIVSTASIDDDESEVRKDISDYQMKNKFKQINNLQTTNTLSHLFIFNKQNLTFSELPIKPFEFIEDSNALGHINDSALSLQLFDGSIERKNPT